MTHPGPDTLARARAFIEDYEFLVEVRTHPEVIAKRMGYSNPKNLDRVLTKYRKMLDDQEMRVA